MLRTTTIALVSAFTAGGSLAATTTTSSSFGENTSTRDYQDTDTFFAGYYVPASARNVVTGLQKFNPSLGTLTGVALTVDFDYDYGVSVQAGPITNPAAAHSVDATYDAMYFVLGYHPGTTTFLVSDGHTSPLYPVSGDAGDPPANGLFPGSGSVSALLKDITGSVDLADFTGTGDVDVLEAIIYLPYSMELTLNNVDSATASTLGEQHAGNITLQYTYEVPEPAGLGLVGLWGLALLRRRHRLA